MRVLIAPDGFGGVLTARQAAERIAEGWRESRPGDEVTTLPLSDGGEGLLEAVAGARDTWMATEVAGPRGHPVEARWLLRDDGDAILESARACGLHLVPEQHRNPMPATTYGVGQLVAAAHAAGARRILVGLGGSATVDGGTGALNGLGFRLRVADGSGLKVGAADLHRLRRVEPAWCADLTGVEVQLLADTDVRLADAAEVFGPQKGATPEQVEQLGRALRAWADVAERDLGADPGLRAQPGSGAAGGLGYGLAAGLGAPLVAGADAVAALVGLEDELARADAVVTGEGRLDATSLRGKVIGHLRRRTTERRLPLYAVVGTAPRDLEHGLAGVARASAPDAAGPGGDPAGDTVRAARRLAAGVGTR